MLAETLVVLDFGTTGLRADRGDRKVVSRYETLVNCHRPLLNHIRAFTGINQYLVDSAPEPWRVFPELLRFPGMPPGHSPRASSPRLPENVANPVGMRDCPSS